MNGALLLSASRAVTVPPAAVNPARLAPGWQGSGLARLVPGYWAGITSLAGDG
jgi:hypothetical protein